MASYSHYEKIYRKLYDGYPIPEFDEFLEIIEKIETSKNLKAGNFVKNTNFKSSFTTNKMKGENEPLKKISIGDKMNNVNKSIFSEKANFEPNKVNEGNTNMQYTMFNDVSIEGSKSKNERIKIRGKSSIKVKNEIIMENAEEDGNNLYQERKGRKMDQ